MHTVEPRPRLSNTGFPPSGITGAPVSGLNPAHVLERIVRPTLQRLDLHSLAAERLIMGTGAQESGFAHLTQIGGPALGLWQIEPATHQDVWGNFLNRRPAWLDKLIPLIASGWTVDDQLVLNLPYSCAIARLTYWRRPEPLPDADDLPGLAAYWKRWFNPGGAEEEFIANYQRLVQPLYSRAAA